MPPERTSGTRPHHVRNALPAGLHVEPADGTRPDECPSLWKLYCRDNPILAEIPEAFDRLQVFEHDARYEYRIETDPTTGEERTTATDMGRGWWYPGEPEKGAHER